MALPLRRKRLRLLRGNSRGDHACVICRGRLAPFLVYSASRPRNYMERTCGSSFNFDATSPPWFPIRRPLIVVLNRVDTAPSAAVAQWKKYLVTEGGLRADNRGGNVPVFFVDSKRGRGVHEVCVSMKLVVWLLLLLVVVAVVVVFLAMI